MLQIPKTQPYVPFKSEYENQHKEPKEVQRIPVQNKPLLQEPHSLHGPTPEQDEIKYFLSIVINGLWVMYMQYFTIKINLYIKCGLFLLLTPEKYI